MPAIASSTTFLPIPTLMIIVSICKPMFNSDLKYAIAISDVNREPPKPNRNKPANPNNQAVIFKRSIFTAINPQIITDMHRRIIAPSFSAIPKSLTPGQV